MYKLDINILLLEDKLGFGLSLKELCRALQIKVPSGTNSRKHLISLLEERCDIEQVKQQGKETKYIIHKIYNEDIIQAIHKNNKFQSYVEQAIINLILSKPYEEMLFLSNLAILEATAMVNDNFKIACSGDMIQLDNREWISFEANEIYNILYRWIRQRLQQMDARHLIQLQKGYRLYKVVTTSESEEIYTYKNVRKNTEEEKVCQELYAKAISVTEEIPKSWDGGWLQPAIYRKLQRNLKRLCFETFKEDGWTEIRVVNVLIPVRNVNILEKRLKDVQQTLNKEAVRKIQTTSRLNHLTGFQRAQITKEIIELNPPVDYKALLDAKALEALEIRKKRQE